MKCLLKNKKLDKFHFSFHLVNRFLIYIPNHKWYFKKIC